MAKGKSIPGENVTDNPLEKVKKVGIEGKANGVVVDEKGKQVLTNDGQISEKNLQRRMLRQLCNQFFQESLLNRQEDDVKGIFACVDNLKSELLEFCNTQVAETCYEKTLMDYRRGNHHISTQTLKALALTNLENSISDNREIVETFGHSLSFAKQQNEKHPNKSSDKINHIIGIYENSVVYSHKRPKKRSRQDNKRVKFGHRPDNQSANSSQSPHGIVSRDRESSLSDKFQYSSIQQGPGKGSLNGPPMPSFGAPGYASYSSYNTRTFPSNTQMVFDSSQPGRHRHIPLPADFMLGPSAQPRIVMPEPHQVLGTFHGVIIRDAQGHLGVSQYTFTSL